MDHLWHLISVQISDRIDGLMKFCVVLQPILAIFLAARSGLRDAQFGARPDFWSLLTTPGHRVADRGRMEEHRSVVLFGDGSRYRLADFCPVLNSFAGGTYSRLRSGDPPYLMLRGIVALIASRLITRLARVPDNDHRP
jgi:hypothetical protein